MKRLVMGLLGLCGALQVFSQVESITALPVASAEYQRIDAERMRAAADFDAQEAACYQRFVINDCLKTVQSARRALFADLKRQEYGLHERERLLQGAAQLQRAQQKALERKPADLRADAQSAQAQTQEKLQAPKDKQAEHVAKAVSEPVDSTVALPSGPSAAEQASYRQSYNAKQAAAEKKRQEVAKRLKEQGGKAVAPLPTPD